FPERAELNLWHQKLSRHRVAFYFAGNMGGFIAIGNAGNAHPDVAQLMDKRKQPRTWCIGVIDKNNGSESISDGKTAKLFNEQRPGMVTKVGFAHNQYAHRFYPCNQVAVV